MTSIDKALGLCQATLSLREHDPRWADLFKTEASLICEALAGVTFEIDHIGSTAVPELQAKPGAVQPRLLSKATSTAACAVAVSSYSCAMVMYGPITYIFTNRMIPTTRIR